MRGGEQQEQLIRRLKSEAERASRMDRPVAGRFLTGEEMALANHAAKECGVRVAFSGGWEDAERVQPCFYPDGDEPWYTLCWVEATWNSRFAKADHRDVFGSLMGLGIDRSYFGDLIVLEGRALLVTLPETAARLPAEWTQAGNVPIKVRELDAKPEFTLPQGDMQRDTVASLRLDAVLASGLRCSRAKAAEWIRQGVVQVNHVPEERTDRMVKVGDLFSIRGFGRIRLREVGETTRKDRFPVLLEVFSSKR